jgi:hypothetical protein
MPTLRMHGHTTATPEQVVEAITDFGPGRQQIFPNSADGYLKVHSQGAGFADVTEGSSGIWERLRYDWSDPHRVSMVTTDSNIWGGASSHTYTLTPRPDGSTDIDVVVVREGKNLRGKLTGALAGSIGKSVITKGFANTVKALDARATA